MKYFLRILCLIFISFSGFSLVFAQTPSPSGVVTVATVNVYNAQITSQKGRTVTISFELSNQVGAQPQVEYGIKLTKTSSQGDSTVDEYIYDETVSLAGDQTISRTVQYTVPNALPAGTYKLWIESKNESGLTLATAYVGTITVPASGSETVELVPSSCFFTVLGNPLHYTTNQVIAVNATSTLTASCTINSTLSQNVPMVPVFHTQNQTLFGTTVSGVSTSSAPITVKPGTNSLSINLPIASKPQTYVVTISLASLDASLVSNPVTFSYELLGPSGSIMNVVFSKSFYQSGDTAYLQIFTNQSMPTSTINIALADSEGDACARPFTQQISYGVSVVSIPIIRQCINPKASVTLSTDENGGTVVLDSKQFSIQTPSSAIPRSHGISVAMLILILAILAIIVGGIFLYKKRLPITLIIIGIVFCGFKTTARADTVAYSGPGVTYTYNINFDKSSYTPGATMNVTASTDITYTNAGSYGMAIQSPGIDELGSAALAFNTGFGNGYFDTSGSPISEEDMLAGIAISPSNGNIYVSDPLDDNVKIFNSSGAYISQFGSNGSGNGQFSFSGGIAFAPSGNVYVSDVGDDRIEEFSSSGSYISQFASQEPGNSQLMAPYQLAVSPTSGDVYVAAFGLNAVKIFSSSGAYISQFGTEGTGNGQFNFPYGVAISPSGDVYVSDWSNSRVEIFSSSGAYISQFGSNGSGNGQFQGPTGITISPSGDVYVADEYNSRVQEFTSTGQYIAQFGSYGSGNGQFIDPGSIALDSSGNAYVADSYNNYYSNDVQEFSVPSLLVGSDNSISTTYTAPTTLGNHTFDVNDYYNYDYVSGSSIVAGAATFQHNVPFTVAVPPTVTLSASPNLVLFNATSTLTWSSTSTNSCSMTTNGVFSIPEYGFVFQFGTPGQGAGQFETPYGIALDSLGNIYVVDSANSVVDKFDSNGNYLSQFGQNGGGDGENGELTDPQGVAIDSSGNFYVTEQEGDYGVQEFNSSGTYVSQFGLQDNGGLSGNGQFNRANGIAISPITGNIYVADQYNNRVEEFSSSTHAYIMQFGSAGNGPGQFDNPEGVAIDSSGRIYVTDYSNYRVEVFNPSGTFLFQFGSIGDTDGHFRGPDGIQVDAQGNIYVSDENSGLDIQKFNSQGQFLSQIGTIGNETNGIALDSSGDIYVTDISGELVQKFSGATSGSIALTNVSTTTAVIMTCVGATGSTSAAATLGITPPSTGISASPNPVAYNGTSTISWTSSSAGSCLLSANGSTTAAVYDSQFGSLGSGNGQFDYPYALAIDSFGDVYVSDTNNDRVEEFSSSGTYLSQFGSLGTSTGQFEDPADIAINQATGDIYVVDSLNSRVEVFNSSGTYLFQFGSSGTGNGQFGEYPSNIAINQSTGNVYISDEENSRVEIFNSSGTYLSQFGSNGSGNGQFSGQMGIAINQLTGNIYIADNYNNRVEVFDQYGNYLSQFSNPDGSATLAVDSSGNVYLSNGTSIEVFNSLGASLYQFGSQGTSTGQFGSPGGSAYAIAISSTGIVYVIDINLTVPVHRAGVISGELPSLISNYIEQFNLIGTNGTMPFGSLATSTLFTISCSNPFASSTSSIEVNVINTPIASISASSTQVAFNTPTNITWNASNINSCSISQNGALLQNISPYSYVSQLGCASGACATGSGNGEMNQPTGVTVDPSGNIYVADTDNNRIQEFNTSGTYVNQYQTNGNYNGSALPVGVAYATVNQPGNVYITDSDSTNDSIEIINFASDNTGLFGGPGTGDDSYNTPTGITVDNGNLYIVDSGNNQVQEISIPVTNGIATGGFIREFGQLGTGNGQFSSPKGISSDAAGNLYVVDTGNNRIEKFNSSGTYLSQFGTTGSGPGQFISPYGIAFDSSGNIYVTDTGNNRVEVFNSSGTYLSQFGSEGTNSGQFKGPTGIAVSASGEIYVTDTGNNRIETFVQSPSVSSSTSSGNITASTTFAIACTGESGQIASSSVTVGVLPLPTADLFASSTSINENASTTISWSSTGSSCSITENGSSWLTSGPASGSQSSGDLSTTTVFTISCTGSSGTATGIPVTITVNGTSTLPVVQSVCIPEQVGSPAGDIYVNESVNWMVSLLNNTITDLQTLWSGTNIAPVTEPGLTFNQIYTTVGQKSINATTTGYDANNDLYTAVCSTSTVVRLGSSVNSEI